MTAEGVCIDRSIVPVILMTKDKTRALRPYARGMYWYKCLRVGSAPFSTSVSFNKCFFSIVSGAFGEALSALTLALGAKVAVRALFPGSPRSWPSHSALVWAAPQGISHSPVPTTPYQRRQSVHKHIDTTIDFVLHACGKLAVCTGAFP